MSLHFLNYWDKRLFKDYMAFKYSPPRKTCFTLKKSRTCPLMFFLMLWTLWTFPLRLFHHVCSSSVGGTWRRFMSQGEYLSVTDQLVLLRWQVSPSPQWCLSSHPLINSQCLAKWALEAHLLPTRDPLTNGELCKDLYLKLCGSLARLLRLSVGALFPALRYTYSKME